MNKTIDSLSLHTIGHAPHNTHEYAQYLTDSERLATYASARFEEEMREREGAELVTVSSPPNGFKMPPLVAVRERDAHLVAYGAPCNVAHDENEESEDEESDLREFARHKRMDGMREHSLLMPSQRGYAEAWKEARSYGFASE